MSDYVPEDGDRAPVRYFAKAKPRMPWYVFVGIGVTIGIVVSIVIRFAP